MNKAACHKLNLKAAKNKERLKKLNSLDESIKDEMCQKYYDFMRNKLKLHDLILLRDSYKHEQKDYSKLEKFIEKTLDQTEELRMFLAVVQDKAKIELEQESARKDTKVTKKNKSKKVDKEALVIKLTLE